MHRAYRPAAARSAVVPAAAANHAPMRLSSAVSSVRADAS